MKLERFKKENIIGENILSKIKGGASGINANFETTSYQQFYESTCDEWNCMDMKCEGYEDGMYTTTLMTLTKGDCL